MVTSIDEIGARNNPQILVPAAIDDAYDFNRDSMVTSIDQIIARNNLAVLDALRLITAPEVDAAFAEGAEHESANAEPSLDDLDWLYEYEIGTRDQRSDRARSSQKAADLLAIRVLAMRYGLRLSPVAEAGHPSRIFGRLRASEM